MSPYIYSKKMLAYKDIVKRNLSMDYSSQSLKVHFYPNAGYFHK